jgi:hypothetical protein
MLTRDAVAPAYELRLRICLCSDALQCVIDFAPTNNGGLKTAATKPWFLG